MSEKKIKSNIHWIVTNAAKVNEKIHETAVMISQWAELHGNCTLAKDLYNAMPASMRRTMLNAWFEKYTPIRFQLKDGLCVKVGMLKPDAKNFVAFDMEMGAAEPFWVMAENTPEKAPMDLAAIMKLVESLANRLDKGADEGKIAPEEVFTAKRTAQLLRELKVEHVPAATEKTAFDDIAVVKAA